MRQISRFRNLSTSPAPVYGFDSFLGLPGKWRDVRKTQVIAGRLVGNTHSGAFSLGGRTPFPENEIVKWVPGWFNESLPPFLRDHPRTHVSFLHVDCDMYSSSSTVLELLGASNDNRLRPGVVVVFDELMNYPEYLEHEMRALWEFLRARRHLAVEVLGTSTRNILLEALAEGRERSQQAAAVRLVRRAPSQSRRASSPMSRVS